MRVGKVIRLCPVLLNRDPTLHHLIFKLVRLSTLTVIVSNVCSLTYYNSKRSSRELMAAGLILGTKYGKSIITPSQDMLIGIYYLSSEVANGKMNNLCNLNGALKAYQLGAVSLRSVVGISTKA